MLENKLHIWSLFGGCLNAAYERALTSYWLKHGRGEPGGAKGMKGDFFALLYIVKKERIMYIEILFWIKNSVYNDEKFC